MADVDKLIVGSSTYTISDSVVRSYLEHDSLKYKGTKMLLIGNSYMRGTGGDNSSFTYTRKDGTTTTYGKGWAYYFIQASGCDADLICQSGGDFAVKANANAFYPDKTYAEALDTYISETTSDYRSEFKYIVVGGGWNDHRANSTEIYKAIDSFCSKCKSNFPNAKIWILPLHCDVGFDAANYLSGFNTWSARAAFNGCGTNSNTFSWFYGRTDMVYGDGVHLNDTGYYYCGRYMLAVLEGWDGDWKPDVGMGWNIGSNVSINGAFRYFRDGAYTYMVGSLGYTNSVATTKLGNINGTYGKCFLPRKSIYFPAFIYGPSTATRWMAPCCLARNDDPDQDGQLRIIPSSITIPETANIYFCASWMYGL